MIPVVAAGSAAGAPSKMMITAPLRHVLVCTAIARIMTAAGKSSKSYPPIREQSNTGDTWLLNTGTGSVTAAEGRVPTGDNNNKLTIDANRATPAEVHKINTKNKMVTLLLNPNKAGL